jgi:sugar lactone lactonase YvrE
MNCHRSSVSPQPVSPAGIFGAHRAPCWKCLVASWAYLVAGTLSPAQEYTFVTLAGPPEADPSGRDGPGSAARFNLPVGIAADHAGNLYVADTANHAIRKIRPGGEVTTLAGLAGQAGTNDGIGSTARFASPSGVALDNTGIVYVADSGNHAIRKITPSGVVTTLAGLASQAGTNDGPGNSARFNWPRAVALDNTTNLYVADSQNFTVRMIAPDGTVTTLAGTAGQPGSEDGTGGAARFAWPSGLAADNASNLYVADSDNHTLRKIAPGGSVTTVAGVIGQAGTNDGPPNASHFNYPEAVAVEGTGNLYVADTFNHTIRKIRTEGDVTTLAGSAGRSGALDGTGDAARFNYPSGLALDTLGQVWVVDRGNHTIRMLSSGGGVTTLAGLADSRGSTDGAGWAARFYNPSRLATACAGTLYVADAWNHTIRKITPTGQVTTLAGLPGQAGASDGAGNIARFRYPSGLAVDRTDSIYVADTANHTIRKITAAGVVSTLAGSAGSFGTNDGTGGAAQFDLPSGVAVDGAGTVYAADTANHTIRKITPDGMVTTLAGAPQIPGSDDGPGALARFSHPQDVAVDTAGYLYVADQWNQTIRKITPQGVVTTLAGTARESGTANGTGSGARFNYPTGVAVDSADHVYVADWGNHTVRRISPGGEVTTLAGLAGRNGSVDGAGNSARFDLPTDVTVDSAGNVYVADLGNNTIRQGAPAAPDHVVIDRATAPVGLVRQLDVTNLTTTGWCWTFLRRPAASAAQLSSSTARNPTFTPDMPDLYTFRLFATNAVGQVVAIGELDLLSFVQMAVGRALFKQTPALNLHSAAGHPCQLLASTNLIDWAILANLINVTGADVYVDPKTDRPCCFYRLRQN